LENKHSAGVPQFGNDYRIPLNELSATAQSVVLKYANDLSGGQLTQADIYVDKGSDGRFSIKESATGNLIAPIDFTDVNIKTQANTKAKEEVVKQGKQSRPESKTFNIVDPNTGKVLMSGVDEAAANKAKAKGYKVQ